MATKIQKTIKVSKRKLKAFRKKAVTWVKKPKNKKIVFIILVVVVSYFLWKKFGKTVTTTTNGSGAKNPHDYIPNPPPTTNPKPGTPGNVTPYPPSNGVMAPKLAEFSYPGHINIVWTGSDGDWTARDTSFVVVPDGYHLANFINFGGLVVVGTIDGFKWPCNMPITFEKGIVKDGVDDLYFYGLNAGDPLRKPDDGRSMSNNTSFAYQTFYFNRY